MKTPQPSENDPSHPPREILNPNLFADEINFSNTEQILFQDDLDPADTPHAAELTDTQADTRYQPLQKINDGGMKTIWEVKDTRTRRTLAMALIQADRIASQDDIQAFLHEARLTAHLQHPHILPIYDIALDKTGNPYFTMKRLRGETLEPILNRLQQGDPATRHAYPLTRLLQIFLNICDAVEYAHTKGVLHLDIKPANIMIGDFGDLHLLDWGLATLITTPDTPAHLTDAPTRTIVGGTPGYMAPEQAHGTFQQVHFHTDIYMLSALLYHLLTLSPPHTGDTIQAILHHTVQGTIPPPQTNNALAAIAMKGLSKSPSDRYPTVAALSHDLRNHLNGYATLAENPTLLTHLQLLINRHRTATLLLLLALLIITTTLTLSFRSIRHNEQLALNALDQLQQKNKYIQQTALAVAPDYLELARQHEHQYRFPQADTALATALAFNPQNPQARLLQAHHHLSQLQFDKAHDLLSQADGIPTASAPTALRLANKYRNQPPITDEQLPALTADFIQHNLTPLLPRLFNHLNRAPLNPQTRFPALQACLQQLNPDTPNLQLQQTSFGAAGHLINLGNNPELSNLIPLTGLPITILNLNQTGRPDLTPLRLDQLRELRLSGTRLERLNEIGDLPQLNVLDISRTRINDLSSILRYPNLTTLNLSNIPNLTLSPRLVWCQKLTSITLSATHANQPLIPTLTARGILLLYETDTP